MLHFSTEFLITNSDSQPTGMCEEKLYGKNENSRLNF